jgi:NADH:ubiquinone oxidoreductase subunit
LKKAKVTKNNAKTGAKKSAKRSAKRREWTKADLRDLKAHSKARTPVNKISKATKRTAGALRAKAFQLGIGLGHQR